MLTNDVDSFGQLGPRFFFIIISFSHRMLFKLYSNILLHNHNFCLNNSPRGFENDVFLADDELSGNKELENIAENFREQAAKLVDMLDISIPVVSKLKVPAIFTLKSLSEH